jgi:hypothetical protein
MEISLGRQLFSFAGALLILVAYIGHQLKWMDARKPLYSALNAVGSGILGYIALKPFQLGFVVLEFVWVAVSVYAMFRNRNVSDEPRVASSE